jgi:hypothetical protein
MRFNFRLHLGNPGSSFSNSFGDHGSGVKMPHESIKTPIGSRGLASRVLHGLDRFTHNPAVIVIGGIWVVLTFAGNLALQWKGIGSVAETAYFTADSARETGELKLAFSVIDKMDCTEDATAMKRQKLIRELILFGAGKYAVIFANQLEACARTPEQKDEAENYRDRANKLDLVNKFYGDLQIARARLKSGVRNDELLGLFEDAASGLPAELGNLIDKEALDAARNARNEKYFDAAAAYYVRAFRRFGVTGSSTGPQRRTVQ